MLRKLVVEGNTKILRETPSMETLQGVLAPGELKRLAQLFDDPEFRSLKRSSGGLLRKGADVFVAEVPRENEVQRVVWSDTDGENPFPRPASRVLRWLQNFKTAGAQPLDVSEEDICPSAALQRLDPATALLQPIR
jgi:hypothetical protein